METKPALGFNCLRGQVDPLQPAHPSLSPTPRAAGTQAASTCGAQATAAATTTATAMATHRACGRSPSTRPSTTAGPRSTTRAAPPRWPSPSTTGASGTPRPVWWVRARGACRHSWRHTQTRWRHGRRALLQRGSPPFRGEMPPLLG